LSGSVGIVKSKIFHCKDELSLACGQSLKEFELVYETYGKLNSKKNNAILIPHALSGNHHVAGKYHKADKYPGWWDNMVGPGKPIDTNQYFVIGVNNIGGNDGSTSAKSINPKTKKLWGSSFPIITVQDWVLSQKKLIEHLGIDSLYAIVGGSLGGMQAIQWSIAYPSSVKKILCIAAAPSLTAQNIAFNEIARQAILQDEDFFKGDFYQHNTKPKKGLRIARMLGHITYLSNDAMDKKFGRKLIQGKYNYNFQKNYEIESYLNYQGDKFASSFDANTYLRMTKALDYFDLEKIYKKKLSKVCSKIKADYLVISFTSDWRFPPTRSKEIVTALLDNNINVSYAEIRAETGHDAFLLHNDHYHQLISNYLRS
jgi:homoserine O-acetyltransferase